MDNVTKFIERPELIRDGFGFNGECHGCGDGSGSGDGDGMGAGIGNCGYGSGNGNLFGFGYGMGAGIGNCGDGDGDGMGAGLCLLDGECYGGGCGNGDGLKSVNGYDLYEIDWIPTGIYRARGNVAKGFFLLNFAPVDCYIVKDGDTYAHGKTLREAEAALREKIMESMGEDEAIEKFVERFKPNTLYKNREYFEWHHHLTGSCRMGRENFCANHGVDMEGESTPEYFIELTKDAYGGKTIRKLEIHYQKQGGRK